MQPVSRLHDTIQDPLTSTRISWLRHRRTSSQLSTRCLHIFACNSTSGIGPGQRFLQISNEQPWIYVILDDDRAGRILDIRVPLLYTTSSDAIEGRCAGNAQSRLNIPKDV